MLVHICCSVDSHYFLEKLKEDYPNEKLTGFFYNPNIHPYSEYALRLLDVQNSCKKLDIELLVGEYNLESWLKKVKGFEHCVEKGERCEICFDDRIDKSFQKAKELNKNKVTTTLLMSPLKSQNMLKSVGEKLEKKNQIEFIFKDYRSGSGATLQNLAVKQNNLYRQNYCGCIYGLIPQREAQKRLKDELSSPLKKQILPQSIEYRHELYKKRDVLEDRNIEFALIKNNFLNYRLLQGFIKKEKVSILSYILNYSMLSKKNYKSKVVTTINAINYLKDEVKLIDLESFNLLNNSSFKSIDELLQNPLSFEEELILREKIVENSFYNLSFIAIIQTVECDKIYEIFLDAHTFWDIKEEIILKDKN